MPKLPGVYFFKNAQGKTIYVGKANSLRDRVRSYFSNNLLPKTALLAAEIKDIDYVLTQSEIDALILEANLIRKLAPRYNVNWKDGKAYPLIEITVKDAIPLVRLVHTQRDPRARYFGPYPTGSSLTRLVSYLRKIFPFISQKHRPGQRCLRSHLGLCPCPDFENYRQTIRQLTLFLGGKRQMVQNQLVREMSIASRHQNFEKAALIKKQLAQIEYLTARRTKPWEYEVNPNLVFDRARQQLTSLENLLGVRPIKKIESYDVSATGGKLATGGQATFVDGLPEKSLYRRYQIQHQASDIEMVREVLARRWNSKIPPPDLIVIDGGKEHLIPTPVPTVSLAKRWETIYFQNKTIRLPAASPALLLLQKLRDEAHRTCRRYHFWLRAKNMLA